MSRRVIGVVLFLMSAPASALAADSDHPTYSAAYGSCIESAGGADFKMAECASVELERQDKMLNATYRDLVARSNPANKPALLKAERAWLSFRDAQCGYQGTLEGEGTMADVILAGCKLEMTARRVQDLGHFLGFERKYGKH